MIEAELIFPAEDKVDGFAIYDSEGKEVEFSLISREKGPMDVFSPINLPGIIEVERCRVYLVRAGNRTFLYTGLFCAKM